MKIEISKGDEPQTFGSLRPGDFFLFGDTVMMKIHLHRVIPGHGNMAAVNVNDGHVKFNISIVDSIVYLGRAKGCEL